MKTFVSVLVLALLALTMAGYAQEAGKTAPPAVVRGEVTVIKATVVAVDQDKRIVTLKDDKGEVQDFKVGPGAVNFSQIKPGDNVMMKAVESVAVEVVKPGMASASGEKTTIVRAKPGEMPGGVVSRQVSTTATVKDIDKSAGTIALMRPDGKTVRIKVIDPTNLDKVKVGDELMITYTQAEALSVERAG